MPPLRTSHLETIKRDAEKKKGKKEEEKKKVGQADKSRLRRCCNMSEPDEGCRPEGPAAGKWKVE